MAVHVFMVSEDNFDICVKNGLVALPEPSQGKNHDNIMDGLLSRLSGIKDDDYILMYIIKRKLLCGVWQADGEPFYDDTPVWPGRIYPFRCRIKCSKYNFDKALKLDDINDLRNAGKIWTWALERATGSNSMFSMSNEEFRVLLTEFLKINPFTAKKGIIQQPYPYHQNNVVNKLHFNNGKPKYEYSIMSLLGAGFSKGYYTDIFGNYTDYLNYVPTNLGTEMDFLLLYDNPLSANETIAYDIIEVKRDIFDEKALKQLIGYESWLLQKKVAGDAKMVRTTAIAESYSPNVIQYVHQRTEFENKPIKLLTYAYINDKLELTVIP